MRWYWFADFNTKNNHIVSWRHPVHMVRRSTADGESDESLSAVHGRRQAHGHGAHVLYLEFVVPSGPSYLIAFCVYAATTHVLRPTYIYNQTLWCSIPKAGIGFFFSRARYIRWCCMACSMQANDMHHGAPASTWPYHKPS